MAMSVACKLVTAFTALLFSVTALADLPRLEHSLKDNGSLSLLVIGDWGRNGEYNQSLVAAQMGKIGEKLDIDFVISTGDNFYNSGLTGVDDKAFEESFTNIYTAKSLQKQWYSVLGNHDYRGNVEAQLSPALREIDSRWLCMRSFIVNAEIIEFFFVDTNPFIKDYWKKAEMDSSFNDISPREYYISNLLKDLDMALKESSAKWKVVVGHHAIRSVSVHGDTVELVEELLPILKDNGVDLYVNGHDHCLERISSKDSPIQFLTSGGGSKSWRGVYTQNADNLQFFYDGQGFMSMELIKEELKMAFYDIFGQNLHEWTMTKDGPYSI